MLFFFSQLDIQITESTPIEESSEILLVVSKNLDSSTAQFIKDSIKKSRNEINQIEGIVNEKKELLKECSNKLNDIDQKIIELDQESEEIKKEKNLYEIEDIAAKKKLYVIKNLLKLIKINYFFIF